MSAPLVDRELDLRLDDPSAWLSPAEEVARLAERDRHAAESCRCNQCVRCRGARRAKPKAPSTNSNEARRSAGLLSEEV